MKTAAEVVSTLENIMANYIEKDLTEKAKLLKEVNSMMIEPDFYFEANADIETLVRQVSNSSQYAEGHIGRAPKEISKWVFRFYNKAMRSYEDMSNKTNKQNYTRDELIALFKTIKVTITEDERTELIEQLQEIIKLGEENKLIVLSNVVCSKCGEEECMEDTDHSSFGGKISNDPLSYAKENLDIYTIDDANNIICNDCMDDLLEDAYENFHMVKKEEDFDYTEILERIGELRKTKTEEEILLMLK